MRRDNLETAFDRVTPFSSIWAPRAALGLTVILLLSLSLLSSLLVWLAYQDQIHSAENRAQSGSLVVGAHVRWIGETAIQALRRVDDALGSDPDAILSGATGRLSDSVTALPGDMSVSVIDADGRFVLTDTPGITRVSVADRPYFVALRDGAEWHVSAMLDGRLSHQKIFVIGRRLQREGRFVGAAIVAVPAALLSEFWASLDLGPDSSVGLIRDDGWLVARHPEPKGPLNLADHVLFTEYLPRAPSGFYHYQSSPADGVSRIVGYNRVEGLPLVAIAAISKTAVVQRFWSQVGSAALIGAPIALALLGISAWVAVLLRRYELQRSKLAMALEQNRILFQEVHHRVKNNLATVMALIRMHALPDAVKKDIRAQIQSMAAVHEQIYLSDQFGTLDLSAYIRRLVDSLQLSHGDRVRLICDLVPLDVDAELAMPLGLIVNEVATNAFKHAFPNDRAGSITITLERLDSDRARIQIRDDGIGFAADPDSPGLGSRLIAGLSKQIGGEVSFASDGGTVFTVTFPIAASEPADAPDPPE